VKTLFLFFVIGCVMYFAPSLIAFTRDRSNKVAILALNTLLGWSLIGWVVSLVWALSAEPQRVLVQQTFQGYQPYPGTMPQQTYIPPPPRPPDEI
jgi:hypothetical protein